MATYSPTNYNTWGSFFIDWQNQCPSIAESDDSQNTQNDVIEPKRHFESTNITQSALKDINGDTEYSGCFGPETIPPPSEPKPENPTTEDSPLINCFPCYIAPCQEPNNSNYQYPEYMICYRDPKLHCQNNMMRYYCSPLSLAKIEQDGEIPYDYDFEAAKTDFNLHSDSEYEQPQAPNRHTCCHPQYQEYSQLGVSSFMPHKSFLHNFNCIAPAQYSFNNHCSCAHPPHMKDYYRWGCTQPCIHQIGYNSYYNCQPCYMYPSNW